MADIKFSEFLKATTSKDSDEIAILQDGVNKMIPSPVLESKIINKTVSRVIQQGGASLNVINLKGVVPTYADLALITPTPELNDAYQVEADGLVYVYTESGFQAEGGGFKVQPDPTGVVEEGNPNAVSGGEVYEKLPDLSNLATKEELATVDGIAKATFGRLMPIEPRNINFDVTNNQLIISGTNRLFTAKGLITPPNGTIEMPAGGPHRIELNTVTSSWEIKQAHAAVVLSNVIVGGYRRSGSRIWVHGIEEYFVNGSVFLKDNYDESRGEFFATGGGVINFDTVNQMVKFPAGRIFHKRTQYFISATSVAKTDSDNKGKIFYDTLSGEISIVPSNQAGTIIIPNSKIQIGLYDINNKIFDISCGIRVNGVNEGVVGSFSNRGELTSIGEGDVNFDLLTMELSITNRCRVTYDDKTVLARAQTISLARADFNNWTRLMFNKTSGDFFFLTISNAVYPAGSIQVGRVFVYSNRGVVSGVIALEIGKYSVNGVESGISRSRIDTAPYIAVNGITDASYVQPDIDGFEWIDNAESSQMYALYDDLVTQHPNYVTRTLLGNDTIGNPIYRYDFTPPKHTGDRPNYAPKMILTSGHHGYEKAGIYVLYAAMKEICTRWEEDERLETLRWGVHFIVVPIVCPYGFDNNTRVNERGVDPDRNYPMGWSSGISDPASGQYRGESPLSEPSAQYVDAILSSNRDAIYFCSFHNMQSETAFMWNASATVFGRNLASSLISRLTGAWNKRFPWATGVVGVGYSDLGAPAGSSGHLSSSAYGIQGGTFEISRRASMAGDETLWGPLVATLGTEVFINWLLLNLEYGAQLKNSHIRLPG